MAPTTTSPQYTYPYPYQAVFDGTLAALATIPMSVAWADPATGIITAKTPMNFFKWGENITVRLWQAHPGYTEVTVTSALKFGLADPFGLNRANLDRVFLALGTHLDHHLAHLRTPPPNA